MAIILQSLVYFESLDYGLEMTCLCLIPALASLAALCFWDLVHYSLLLTAWVDVCIGSIWEMW